MEKNEKKIRNIRSEVVSFNADGTITLKLHDEIDMERVKELLVDGRSFTYLEFYDKDTITDLQRNHYWALVGDIHEYTGTPEDSIDSRLRFEFMAHFLLEEYPSTAKGGMSKLLASQLLEFTITFCIQNEIPFRKQQFYLTIDTSKMLFLMTMKRMCLVCGEPHAQAHHATNLVGRGRNRKTHDHWNSTFMTLCTEHHTEVHNLGLTEFMKKYYVKPVKLTVNQLKQLGVM